MEEWDDDQLDTEKSAQFPEVYKPTVLPATSYKRFRFSAERKNKRKTLSVVVDIEVKIEGGRAWSNPADKRRSVFKLAIEALESLIGA